jgi:hypothetical protein
MPGSMRRLLIAIAALACLATPVQALAARGTAGKAERLTERTILDLNEVLDDARADLAEVADLPSVHAQDGAACESDTQAFDDQRYTAFGAADIEGDVYCLSIGLASPINIADRAYFLRTVGTRQLSVGDYQLGRQTGLQTVGLGYPVIGDSGAVTGISLATLWLDWLGNRVERRQSARSADNLVIDDHGTVLARSGLADTDPGTNIASTKLAKSVLRDDFGVGRFRIAGDPVDAAWGIVPLSDGEMHVAVSVPR